MSFDEWSLPARAISVNIIGVAGVWLGVINANVPPSPVYVVRIGLGTLLVLNFLFLAVRPRIMAERKLGDSARSDLCVIADLFRDRWIICGLVVNQLVAVSLWTEIGVIVAPGPVDRYIRGFSNAPLGDSQVLASATFFILLAAIWLGSAIGVWRARPWAWWLALALNVMLATWSLIRLFVARGSTSIDAQSVAAVIVLLLPSVRNRFLPGRKEPVSA